MEHKVKLTDYGDVKYGPRFTVEIVLHQFDVPRDIRSSAIGLPWLTLFAAGETPESTVWRGPEAMAMTGLANSPLLRIGLTRKSRILMAEIVDFGQDSPVRIISQAEIPNADRLQIGLTVDSVDCVARLFVNSRQVTDDTALTPAVKLSKIDSVFCGSASNVPAIYYRVWRRCLSADQLSAVKCREVASRWDDRFKHPNLDLETSVSKSGDIAWSTVAVSQKSKLTSEFDLLADRVLRLQGNRSADSLKGRAKREAAAATVSTFVDELSILVEDPTKSEPDLLKYFRDNPAAAILVNPSIKQQWREVLLQDHGQIDFVLEQVDGRFIAVEIEPSQKPLFTTKDEITNAVQHAVHQTELWVRGVSKNHAASLKRFGTSDSSRFDRLVVIGRSTDLNTDARREVWDAWASKGTLLRTWDDLINAGRMIAKRLQNPSVSGYSWQ
jgi:hypothetical protein